MLSARDTQQEPDMTQRLTENWWLVDWSLVTIMGNTMPPRDPNDDDDDETKTTRTSTTNIGAATRFRQTTARSFAQPVRRAPSRQSGGVAPLAKALAEMTHQPNARRNNNASTLSDLATMLIWPSSMVSVSLRR
jgi:hypothetical protein